LKGTSLGAVSSSAIQTSFRQTMTVVRLFTSIITRLDTNTLPGKVSLQSTGTGVGTAYNIGVIGPDYTPQNHKPLLRTGLYKEEMNRQAS
jgi:hypothetical protein